MPKSRALGRTRSMNHRVPEIQVAMKILHIITGLERGGAERQLINLLRASVSYGLQYEVVSLLDGGVYHGEVRSAGAELHTLNMTRNRISLSALFRLAKLIRQ